MAYIGGDGYLAAWAVGDLEADRLAETSVLLLEAPEEQNEPENPGIEPTGGFIIQDWFGPFLLGPSSRYLRGRC
jgi:hypothetical protein|uniref:Uncharacterized protein n=1 Tax=Desulfobacca acetoxidans TaxID=60893 RepID=A0A7C5ENS8_9BACT